MTARALAPFAAVCLSLSAGASAAPRARPADRPPASRPPPPPRPFRSGSLDFGFSLGVATGAQTSVSVGGQLGYFVLPGVEPGVKIDVTFGADRPTVTSLLPFLRWVFYRSYVVSPYLKAQGGRFIISGQRDVNAIGGGGGLILFFGGNVGLQVEAVAYRLFPTEVCATDCTSTDIGVSIGYFWSPPRRRRRRPPPPPVMIPRELPPSSAPAPAAPASPRHPDEPTPPRVDEPGFQRSDGRRP